MPWHEHLITLPVVLPLLFGAMLVMVNERRHNLKFWLNMLAVTGLLCTAVLLLVQVDGDGDALSRLTYQSANWDAPFGISLVVDRLSALMLLLVAAVALAALCFSYQRWAKAGPRYHALFLFLLMGMNGALITGDLFNLFVFFEVMLAASYGLLLHGKNATRVRAGMNFIALNLVAALFFLIGIALIYSSAGTLNLADLAVKGSLLSGADKTLFETGIVVMSVTFLAKCGIWPLGFWIPAAYSAAVPPVAALLTLVTKMGVYVLYRLWPLVVAGNHNQLVELGSQCLFWAGVATMIYASLGLLASHDSRYLVSYSAMLSSGILVALLGFGQNSLASSALFYLASSALAVAAFMLLLELADRLYSPSSLQRAEVLKSLNEEDTEEDAEEETPGVVIPAAMAFLGLSFMGCALVLAGMPPMSGFVAKLGIITNLLTSWDEVSSLKAALFIALLLLSGGFAIVALLRLGVRAFWAVESPETPKLLLSEATPILWLLSLCILMAALAGPVRGYMDRTGTDLFAYSAVPVALVAKGGAD